MPKPIVAIFLVFIFSCSGENSSNTKKEEVSQNPASSTPSEEEAKADFGTDENPIDFYFTPSVTSEQIEAVGSMLENFLEIETGLEFRMNVPDSYDELIAAFENDAEVALMSSTSYVKANEAYGASAQLKSIRYGSSSYYGQIIASAASGINELKDINGKTFLYTDSASGSGYLFPRKILKDNYIEPASIGFAGEHDEVVRRIYNGQADAGATFYSEPAADGEIRDARARLLSEYPDVEDKIKIIQVTDPIPNDPVVYAKRLPRGIRYKVSLALLKFTTESESGKQAMDDLYAIQGFNRTSDGEYDELREALND